MPYVGRLEDRPLLDMIQIVAYSHQSGILTVKGSEVKGLVIFHDGNVVCAYSPTALSILVKAAKESDEAIRLSLRRIQILTALRELFDLVEGDYRFVKRDQPVPELEGLDISSFYRAGALDTGDLLLVLENAMDAEVVAPEAVTHPADAKGAEQRRFPRYGPIIIRGTLDDGGRSLEGHLTNLSEGGTFFHADTLPGLDDECQLSFELPWDLGPCRVETKVVWLRAEGPNVKRGAGLSFRSIEADGRDRIMKYLSQFRDVAEDIDIQA
jgi:hypothetical protein